MKHGSGEQPPAPLIWDGILVAAGRGDRLGFGYSKAFALLAGLPLFVHSLRTLWRFPGRNRLVLVAPPDDLAFRRAVEQTKQEFNGEIPLGLEIIPGGERRQDSVLAGLNALHAHRPADDAVVLVHDAARPLASPALIRRCLAAMDECLPTHQDELPGLSTRTRPGGPAGVVPGLPVQETLKLVFESRVVLTQPRENLYAVQTPQVFRFGPLLDAHQRARRHQVTATDDAALLERHGTTVLLVAGEAGNLKITVPGDLDLAERLLPPEGP